MDANIKTSEVTDNFNIDEEHLANEDFDILENVNLAIQITDFAVDYDDETRLEDINLCIESGDFAVLFGPDDVGKSVLLNVIMGFDMNFKGEVKLFGTPIDKLTVEERHLVRFVPDQALYEDGSAYDYFKLVSNLAHEYNHELQNELCNTFNIDLDEYICEMTYQDNKLVQIIAAICTCPELLILDEPAKSLTSEAFSNLLVYLKEWNAAGISILITTQEYEEVRGYCNCYAYMKEGKILAADNVSAPDVRKKIISVEGGKINALERSSIQMVAEKNSKKSYIYEGSMDSLAMMLGRSHFNDWLVEDMTLAEELTDDYSRWE